MIYALLSLLNTTLSYFDINTVKTHCSHIKNWFGDGIEQKIVESAIVFWFKDADCKAENKVVEYLGEY